MGLWDGAEEVKSPEMGLEVEQEGEAPEMRLRGEVSRDEVFVVRLRG